MKEASFLLLFCAIFFNNGKAQDKGCNIILSGKIVEAATAKNIAHAHIKVANQITVLSNHYGYFQIKNLCKGTLNFSISHIAYEPMHYSIDLRQDSTISISLINKSNTLETVLVESTTTEKNSIVSRKISKESRLESQGKNLAEVLNDVSGVSILKTGSTIAKPVVNGLFGNRLILLNNGVRHESQQWGTDHAPEIDPFSAQEIAVIKNADAVRYGPDALGGIVKMSPSPIAKDKIAAGNINLGLNSNGRGGFINTQFEGSQNNFAYRIGITGLKAGNIKTADYYLGNTGKEELNSNIALHYNKDRHNINLFLSHFGTSLGIFEGAHIGSKEDIIARIKHGRPFENYSFSYNINSPRQRVDHSLAKLGYTYEFNNNTKFESFYSIQRNHRKEFDLRRAVADNVPMANIILTTQQIEAVWSTPNTMLGISGSLQINNNVAGTGTTPIIPNFDNHTFGAFASHKIIRDKNTFDLGVRYDYKYFDAAGYRYDYEHIEQNGSLQQYLLEDQKHFHNISGIAGVATQFNKEITWKNNIGLAWRAPSANELYSDGIHHGTGTYEVGDINLKSEKGLKFITSLQYQQNWLNLNVDAFAQYIDNYIFSQPDPDSIRQTIRGTFPLFQYEQDNAMFYGSDISSTIKFSPIWQYHAKISIVRAKNITDDTYLPYIPSDKIQHDLSYRFQSKNNFSGYLKFKHHYQARQQRYEANSDFAAPPAAYNLFDLIGSVSKNHKNGSSRISVAFENIFNTSYKDYMDRFRYYSHGLGRNISIRINHTF